MAGGPQNVANAMVLWAGEKCHILAQFGILIRIATNGAHQ